MNEIWKPIEGTDGKYEVSNLGKVRGNGTRGAKNGVREISQRFDRYGYKRINCYTNGKMKSCTVHRLVAAAFIENPDNLPQVNHIDGNKENNCVENLEWCTASRNVKHAFDIGLKEKSREHARRIGEEHNRKTSKKVRVFDADGVSQEFESISEACRALGVNRRNVNEVLREGSRRKTAGGYKWELF